MRYVIASLILAIALSLGILLTSWALSQFVAYSDFFWIAIWGAGPLVAMLGYWLACAILPEKPRYVSLDETF